MADLSWNATSKFIKESHHKGCEAQAFSGSYINFLTAIGEVRLCIICLGFFRKVLQGAALSELMAVGHFETSTKIFGKNLRSQGQCG